MWPLIQEHPANSISNSHYNHGYFLLNTPCMMLNLVRECILMSFNRFYAASFVLFKVKEGLLLHIENIKGK